MSVARRISSFSEPEIKKLLYRGKPVYSDARLAIKALSVDSFPNKILVITPKKIGTAPQRNLLRRRLKALFYEQKLYERGLI